MHGEYALIRAVSYARRGPATRPTRLRTATSSDRRAARLARHDPAAGRAAVESEPSAEFFMLARLGKRRQPPHAACRPFGRRPIA